MPLALPFQSSIFPDSQSHSGMRHGLPLQPLDLQEQPPTFPAASSTTGVGPGPSLTLAFGLPFVQCYLRANNPGSEGRHEEEEEPMSRNDKVEGWRVTRLGRTRRKRWGGGSGGHNASPSSHGKVKQTSKQKQCLELFTQLNVLNYFTQMMSSQQFLR